MALLRPTRAALWLALAVALGACGDDDDDGTTPVADAGSDAAAAPDAGPAPTDAAVVPDAQANDLDAGQDATVPSGDGATPVLAACLDRPNELPRPPAGELPCELLPPGFSR